MTKPQCAYWVFSGQRIDFRGHACTKSATVTEEDGTLHCHIHSNAALAEKDRVQRAKWEATKAVWVRDAEVKRIGTAILDAGFTLDQVMEKLRG